MRRHGTRRVGPSAGPLLALASVVLPGAAHAVPDDFDAIPVRDPGAFDFVNGCGPLKVSRKEFDIHVGSVEAGKVVTTRSNDAAAPFLRWSNGRILCVEQSPSGNPVLPLSVFDETIRFEGMSPGDTVRLRTELSEQLALSGVATVLVVHPSGNATLVGYLFTQLQPDRVHYRSSVLGPDVDPSSHGTVIEAVSDRVTATARGSDKVHYKPLFAD